MELDLARREVERQPREPTAEAAVGAEVADVDRVVTVGQPAGRAARRVGGVGQSRARVRGIVEPVAEHPLAAARELAEQGIVGVDDEQRIGMPRDRLAPAERHELELAVAVELVTEEVSERDHPG